MNIQQIVSSFSEKTGAEHRYASYDYCYNYFYKNVNNIVQDMEKSCAILGFYLASWGMMRGSSFLLQKSYKYFSPLISYIANQPKSVWDIDVDNYTEDNIQLILDIYNNIKEIIMEFNRRDIVLVTKIMLGVFGIVPAYDEYFCKTFKEIEPKISRFSTFTPKSLDVISRFYSKNKFEIDKLAKNAYTIDFVTGENKFNYPKAKIIDMYGFSKGNINSTKSKY